MRTEVMGNHAVVLPGFDVDTILRT
jgi:hypothetical protein